MRQIYFFIFLFTLSLALSGCSLGRHLPEQKTIIRDSVAVHIKDTTIVHVDTIYFELPKESSAVEVATPETKASHLETSVASSDAYVDADGHLHHSLDNKEGATLLKEVQIPETWHEMNAYTFEHREIEFTPTEIREVEKPLTWWQKLWITSGKILWGIVAMLIFVFLVKIILKFK